MPARRVGCAWMGVDRQALTPDDLAARRFIVERARAAGAAAFQDGAGNFFLRWPGQYDTPAVAAGGHVDSQPSGGSLDGAYGVCANIEVLAALSASGHRYARPVEVVIGTNEEGCRFAPGRWDRPSLQTPGGLSEFLGDRHGRHDVRGGLEAARRRLSGRSKAPLRYEVRAIRSLRSVVDVMDEVRIEEYISKRSSHTCEVAVRMSGSRVVDRTAVENQI
jgi:Peptidase family M20/M25/M40